MIISNVEQGTPEWLQERAGKVTASNFDKILTAGGGRTNGQTRKTYLYQCAAELISGMCEDSFTSNWMERGKELENDARSNFEQETGLFVGQVGLIYMDERRVISCSPDGLCEDRGLEIKVPKGSTHVGYLDAGILPNSYVQQVQGSLMVSGLEAWWFMSYHPSPLLKNFILEVMRDEAYITLLREAVEEFNSEIEELVGRLRG